MVKRLYSRSGPGIVGFFMTRSCGAFVMGWDNIFGRPSYNVKHDILRRVISTQDVWYPRVYDIPALLYNIPGCTIFQLLLYDIPALIVWYSRVYDIPALIVWYLCPHNSFPALSCLPRPPHHTSCRQNSRLLIPSININISITILANIYVSITNFK